MSARLRHALMLAAFVALILAPTGLTIRLLAAAAALTAVRSARLMSRRLRSSRSRDGEVVLGVDRRGRLVRLGDAELSAHGLILGASGAGKTTTLLTILSDQIRRGRPVVHHHAVIQHIRGIGDVERHAHVLFHDQDRHAFLLHGGDDLGEPFQREAQSGANIQASAAAVGGCLQPGTRHE